MFLSPRAKCEGSRKHSNVYIERKIMLNNSNNQDPSSRNERRDRIKNGMEDNEACVKKTIALIVAIGAIFAGRPAGACQQEAAQERKNDDTPPYVK